MSRLSKAMTWKERARTGIVVHHPSIVIPCPAMSSTGGPVPVLSQYSSMDPFLATGMSSGPPGSGRLGRCRAPCCVPPLNSPDALREFSASGVGVRSGDFNEPGSLATAFAGGHRMLLISTDAVGHRVPQHRAAINAALAAGVGHVVYTSHPNPVATNPIGAVAAEHGETEEMLHDSGLAWTVLRFGS